jgi:CheY-like chemotaxis protein
MSTRTANDPGEVTRLMSIENPITEPSMETNVKILYLEDSDMDIDIVRRYVRSMGDNVFESTKSAADALTYLHAEHPDIFFIDIMIDGQAVYDVLHVALEEELARYIVPMTARVLPTELEYYQSLGCSYVIPKPFTIDMLDEMFAQIS